MDLIALLDFPWRAKTKSGLSKEIRATEAELRTLDARAHLFRQMPMPDGLLLALSSPVFTF